MKEYTVANILDLLETVGEDKVSFALSEFSCPRNAEIEDFIHNNAIDFAKEKCLSLILFLMKRVR